MVGGHDGDLVGHSCMVVSERDAAHVWAGTFDPQQSKVVQNVKYSLRHRMLEPAPPAGTPGQEVKRERDREEFQKALAQLNDGLSDLCFNMRRSEPVDEVSWPLEMEMPYPASARSSNLSKATSVPAPRKTPSSNGSDSSATSFQVQAPSGFLKQAQHDQSQITHNKHVREVPRGAKDVFQHDFWVDERVSALMQQVKDAQAKLGPKMHDKNEIAALVDRLDVLERRSAVAGHRSTSTSDPPVSGRHQGHYHVPHSPFSLPTIREVGARPPNSHRQQQYNAHPPAQRPLDLLPGHNHWRNRPYLQGQAARSGPEQSFPFPPPAGMLLPPIRGLGGPNANVWIDNGDWLSPPQEYGDRWRGGGYNPHNVPPPWKQESPQVQVGRIETQSGICERRQPPGSAHKPRVGNGSSDAADAVTKLVGRQSAHIARRRYQARSGSNLGDPDELRRRI